MTDVLIVEDDRQVGEVVQNALQHEGFSVRCCKHPLEAIEYLSQEPYRLLMTEMKTPQISGQELLVWANYYFPQMQSLLLTDSPDSAESLVLPGSTQVIAKPFESRDFLRQIRLCMSPGVASNIKQIQLSELLQILALEPHAMGIEVNDSQNNATAYIGLEHQSWTYAEWVSARGERLLGEKACSAILGIKRGMFKESRPHRLMRNMSRPMSDMLMTTTEQLDAGHQSLSAHFQGKRHFSQIMYASEQPQKLRVLLKVLENQHFDLTPVQLSGLGHVLNEASLLFHLTAAEQLPDLLEFCHRYPATPVIVLNQWDPSIQQLSLPNNIVRHFSFPWDQRALRDYLATHHQQGLSGYFQNLGLLSQVQLFLMSHKPKRINVKNLRCKLSGTLYMAGGQFIEAELGTMRGEAAFYQLMRTTHGTVIELDWQEPASCQLEQIRPLSLLMNVSRHYARLSDLQTEIIEKLVSFYPVKASNA